MIGLKNKIMYLLLAVSLLGLTGCLGTEANTFSSTESASTGDILLIDESDDDIDAGDEDESEDTIAEDNQDSEDDSVVDEEIDIDSEISDTEDVVDSGPSEEDPVSEDPVEEVDEEEEVAEEDPVSEDPVEEVDEEEEVAEEDPVSEDPVEEEEEVAEEDPVSEDPVEEEEEVAEEDPVSEDPVEEEEEVAQDDSAEEDPVEEDDVNNIHCKRRGNLIRNGSFEIVDDRKGEKANRQLNSIAQSGWDIYKSLPSKDINEDSWVTTDGAGIEVQGYSVVTNSKHGLRKVELDSHGSDSNSSMAQKVYLCKGKYTLRFAYYPRTKSLDDNIITVKLNDKQIKSVNKVHDGKWHNIRRSFKIQKSGIYKISFSAEGKENTLGGLVDHVRLNRKMRRAGVITSLLALGDMDNINSPMISSEISTSIVHKLVNYASIKRKPRILIVKDGNHNGESVHDYDLVHKILVKKHGEDKVKVVSGSVSLEQAMQADVLFVINPGHPLGSRETADVVRKVIETGRIGVVLSGDDMARGAGFSLNDITGVKYTNNGVRACGVYMDNNLGTSYKVKLKKRFFRRLSKNERVLNYGNDIDHVEVERKGVKVFAKSMTEACGKEVKYPTIFGYKLKKLSRAKIKEILSQK